MPVLARQTGLLSKLPATSQAQGLKEEERIIHIECNKYHNHRMRTDSDETNEIYTNFIDLYFRAFTFVLSDSGFENM